MEMKVACCDEKQDRFALVYMQIASELSKRFGMGGRGVVRDSIRGLAKEMGLKRRSFLIENGLKPNLKNLFTKGGPAPCGLRCDKEWIKVSAQEVFVNVSKCPYADVWNKEGEPEIGKMFCEEYYPEYVHWAASDKAQIDTARELVNEGDNFCRHSFYLRPANLDPKARQEIFEEFDLSYHYPDKEFPVEGSNYDEMLEILLSEFVGNSSKWLDEEGCTLLKELVGQYQNTGKE